MCESAVASLLSGAESREIGSRIRMPGMFRARIKLAHMLKLTLPVASMEEPEGIPMLLDAGDARRLEGRLPYRAVVPMEERLRAGDRCYAIPAPNGEVSSFVWVASGREMHVYELGDSVRVPESVAYLYDGFTFPEARGRGLISETVRGIVADLVGSATERCETWVARRNAPSLRAYGKAGFEVYGWWRVAAVGTARVCLGEPWIARGLEQA